VAGGAGHTSGIVLDDRYSPIVELSRSGACLRRGALKPPSPEDLYDVINERYERGSILLTSNHAQGRARLLEEVPPI